MKNPKTYTALSILGFIISAIFTVIMFCSNSTGILIACTMFGAAILWEFGKYALLYQGIYGPFGTVIRFILICGWFFVTVGSIIASSSQVLNDANENKNITIENSAAFQQQQDAISQKKDLYSVKKKEIEDLKALQIKQQINGDSIVNSMPRDYIDRKNQAKAETANQIAKTQEIINAKSNELTQITNELSTPQGELKVETLDTTGAMSMFKLMANKLNQNPKTKKNPYTAEEVGIFFYMLLGLGIEFLANIFAFLSQYYANNHILSKPSENSGTQSQSNTANNKIVSIPHSVNNSKGITASSLKSNTSSAPITYGQTELQNNYVPEIIPQKVIGFVPPTPIKSTFTNADWNKYVEYMFSSARGSTAQGYRKISESVGLSHEIGRKIKGALEQENAINIVGNRSIIQKTKEDILRA